MKIRDFKNREIDNGFFYITEKEAISICRESDPLMHFCPILPKEGWERKVKFNGQWWWLARTIVKEKSVWSIRQII